MGRDSGLASFPGPIRANPYQRLLYHELSSLGLRLVPCEKLRVTWLLRSCPTVRYLHFHWPGAYYRHRRRLLAWLRLILFGTRLVVGRFLRFRIVWTIHEVYQHDGEPQLVDRVAAKILARMSNVLFAHDTATIELAGRELGRSPHHIVHGSYVGVYEPGRSRADVRRELGVADDALLYLSFGHVKGYKSLDVLLKAFALRRELRASLVVAGLPLDRHTADATCAAAVTDSRVKPILEYVADERVAELFDAADVVVLPRGDGGTSGALILALSLGRPVIAAQTPTYAELLAGGRAGWFFAPGDARSLAGAMNEAAAADSADLAARGAAARAIAEDLSWAETAVRTAQLIGFTPDGDPMQDPRVPALAGPPTEHFPNA